jgi:hypothetical protein
MSDRIQPNEMNRPVSFLLLRDALALFALYILSALGVKEIFGTNDVFGFSWLASGPTVYLVAVHGYRILGVALIATIVGNLIFGTLIETVVWNSLGSVIVLGFGGWIYRNTTDRRLLFVEIRDFFRLFGAALGMAILAATIATLQSKANLPVLEVNSFLHRIAGFAFGFVITMTLLLVAVNWRDRKEELANRILDGTLIICLAALCGHVLFLNGLHDSLGQIARGY